MKYSYNFICFSQYFMFKIVMIVFYFNANIIKQYNIYTYIYIFYNKQQFESNLILQKIKINKIKIMCLAYLLI